MNAGPHIRSVHVTTWNHDEWTRGPYSSLGVGGRPHHRSDLTVPVSGRLFFAGEHTSVEHPATMHGAYNSGLAAAQKVADLHTSGDALIIGAGLAGLGAARTLLANGWSVTVLEATRQAGGRARTEHLQSGLTIHPGAAWIHGPIGNPIAAIADAVGSIGVDNSPSHETGIQIDANGKVRRLSDESLATSELAANQVLEQLRRRAEAARLAELPDVAMRVELQEALRTIADLPLRAATKVIVDVHFESLMAADLDDLSFQHGDEPYAYPGGDRYLTTPLQPIVELLADGVSIQFGCPVRAVRLDDHEVALELRDGSSHRSDVCVVTVPLGALQSGEITFEPLLPNSHREALRHLKMGDKCKVFVEFTEPWWGDVEHLWSFPHFTEVHEPTRWGSWVDTSQPCGAPVLCGFVGGTEGRRVQQLFLDDPATLTAELAEYFATIAQAF